MENEKVDTFKKCERCGHSWLEHYKLIADPDGAEKTPQHTVGVCKVAGCDCEKFIK